MAAQDLRPFRWATALLQCCVPVRDREMVAGDLLEEFREEGRGHWWYLRQVASFVWCRDTRLAMHVCTMWFAAFCGAELLSMMSAFMPAYGVAVFLFAIPLSAFYVARKTDWFGLAFTASVLLMFAILAVCEAAVKLPGSLWFPIAVGGVLALLGALAGKCSLPVFEATLGDALHAAPRQTLRRSSC